MILTLIKGAYCMNLFTKHRKRTLLLAAVAAVGVIGAALVMNCGANGTKPGKEPGTDSTGTGTDSTPTTTPKEPGEIKTVTIGGKVWMAENLNVMTPDGNSWCFNEDATFCKWYGRLYDWQTATTVCPKGWRLPSSQDWDNLVKTAGGEAVAGSKLKAGRDWAVGGGGTDSLGFSALPGGIRLEDGAFRGALFYGYWWSGTEKGDEYAYYYGMSSYDENVAKDYEHKVRGHSIRCVKD
jgi:uncharacterized protein (TIGR02145 family)